MGTAAVGASLCPFPWRAGRLKAGVQQDADAPRNTASPNPQPHERGPSSQPGSRQDLGNLLDSASALLRHTDGGGGGSAASSSGTPRRGVGATAGDLVALQQQQRNNQSGAAGASGSNGGGGGGGPVQPPARKATGNRRWYNARVRGLDADPEEHTFFDERRNRYRDGEDGEGEEEDEDGGDDDYEEAPYERDARLRAETQASLAAERASDARKSRAAARRAAAGEPDDGVVDGDDFDDDDDDGFVPGGGSGDVAFPNVLEADILQRVNFDMGQLTTYLASKGRHEGDTPLHIASQEGHVEVAYWILMEGADCGVANQFGDTALHHAARWNHVEVARLLLKGGAPVNARNSLGWTPLHSAVAYSASVDMADALLDAGGDVAAGDAWGRCPIHFAASNGDARAVAMLMSRGAVVDSVTAEGDTPLHYAVGYGHSHVVALLLRTGANVRRRKRGGVTALHFAAAEGHDECVQLLLEDGADAGAVDDTGVTPLHMAAGGEHTQSALLLLDAGADANVADETGVTPLDLVPYEKEELYHLLVEGALPSDDEDGDSDDGVLRLTQEAHTEPLELGWSGDGDQGVQPRLALLAEPHVEELRAAEEEEYVDPHELQEAPHQLDGRLRSQQHNMYSSLEDGAGYVEGPAPGAFGQQQPPFGAAAAPAAVGGGGGDRQMEADLRALGFSAAEVASYMASLTVA